MQESEFKARKRSDWLKRGVYKKVFFIETESTEKGFPDSICVDDYKKIALYEFKVSHGAHNEIEFERNQPLWYKKHAKALDVYVIAYDNVTKLTHCFPALALFNPLSEYHLPLGSLRKQLPQYETNYTVREYT